MMSKTGLNIQDYFNYTGIGGRPAHGLTASASTSAQGNSFSKILENMQSAPRDTDEPARRGVQIHDYWQRPISARIPAPACTPVGEKQIAVAVEPTPVPEGPVSLPDTADPASSAVQGATDLGPDGSTPPSTADRIAASIQSAAARYDLPPGLIHSVIRAESNFQPQAVSAAGARGLMQLMPATAEELGVEDPFDIQQNIDGGARYLRQMLDRFGGDLRQALAAYNAGPGTVARYKGDVPYAETRDYVRKVLHYSRQYRV